MLRVDTGLKFDVFPVPGSARVCYVLIPDGVSSEIGAWAEKASAEHDCTVALVSGMDWNNDMTPWPAEGVMKKKKPFGGGASRFLERLVGEHIPEFEKRFGLVDATRCLTGISLSGLFALWSMFRTDFFSGGVASVSGSLWYDGFSEYLEGESPVSSARAYISLGDREKETRDTRMATVEERTLEVVDIFKNKGMDVVFEMVPGTHFSPLAPKLDGAMDALLRKD